jgi:hypothetical protein
MKPMIAIRLLGPLTVVLGAALPAWAQTTDFTKWLCEIDLSDLGRPSEFTIDTKKHCPGNDPTQSVTIECNATIANFTGPASTMKVPCSISGDQCGFPDTFFLDTQASRNINSAGEVRLFCRVNR